MKLLALFITVVTLSVSACRSSSADYQEKLEKVSTSELRSITDDQGYIMRAKEASEESSFFEVCLKKEDSVEAQEGTCVYAFRSYDRKPIILYKQTMREHLLKEKADSQFNFSHLVAKLGFGGLGALVGLAVSDVACIPISSVALQLACLSGIVVLTSGSILLVGHEMDKNFVKKIGGPIKHPILWRLPKAQQAALTLKALDEEPHKVKSVLAALENIGSYLKKNIPDAKYLHQYCVPKAAGSGKEICREL